MTCAPWSAAFLVNSMCFSIIESLSPVQVACSNAPRTIRFSLIVVESFLKSRCYKYLRLFFIVSVVSVWCNSISALTNAPISLLLKVMNAIPLCSGCVRANTRKSLSCEQIIRPSLVANRSWLKSSSPSLSITWSLSTSMPCFASWVAASLGMFSSK